MISGEEPFSPENKAYALRVRAAQVLFGRARSLNDRLLMHPEIASNPPAEYSDLQKYVVNLFAGVGGISEEDFNDSVADTTTALWEALRNQAEANALIDAGECRKFDDALLTVCVERVHEFDEDFLAMFGIEGHDTSD